jgi:hypothetical protein
LMIPSDVSWRGSSGLTISVIATLHERLRFCASSSGLNLRMHTTFAMSRRHNVGLANWRLDNLACYDFT